MIIGNNAAAGICLTVDANSGKLNAVGNTFRGIDCSSQTNTLLVNPKACTNVATCTGGVCDLGYASAALAVGNSIDVSQCGP